MRLFSGRKAEDPALLFTGSELRGLMPPLLLEQLLIVLMSIINTMMVSSGGEDAVSAVSLVDSINVLLVNVFVALATGGAVITAQYLGRKEPDMAGKAARQLLYVMLAVSLAISVLALLFYRVLLRAVFPGVNDAVMTNAATYFLLIIFSFPFLSVFSGGSALMRAVGNSKASLITTLMVNVINVAGNALLIYVFRLGVKGAALAAVAARFFGAAVILLLLKNPRQGLVIPSLKQFTWDSDMVKRILSIGVPNGVENGFFQLGKILLQSLVSALGVTAMAANAVANSLAGFQNIPGSAVSLAMITVVGRCVGASEYGQAKLYVKKLMRFSYWTMGLLAPVILLLLPGVIGSYGLSPEVAQNTWQLMFVYTIVCAVFWPSSFAFPNALRAAGDVKFTMAVSALSMLIFRIGFSYLLVQSLGMGLMGVWVAMMIDWVARSAAFYIRYRRGVWEHRKVL